MLLNFLLFCREMALIYSEKESYKHNNYTTNFLSVVDFHNKTVFVVPLL